MYFGKLVSLFFKIEHCVAHLTTLHQKYWLRRVTVTKLMYGPLDASCKKLCSPKFCNIYTGLLFVIRYTLLVGKPPFETSSLKETYSKIKRNEYRIPSTISHDAHNLIQKLLQSDPKHRPTTDSILTDPFFQIGFIPAKLPIRCKLVYLHLFCNVAIYIVHVVAYILYVYYLWTLFM